jgi:DNA-binding NarL/FixJ family response regulator
MLAAEPDIEVAAEAGSGPEAVALAGRGGFDVILMDLRMPGGDGVAATAAIHAQAIRDRAIHDRAASDRAIHDRATRAPHSARVVVLTTYDTDADILRAVEAGASGYLLKDATASELADAIRAAARGETVLAPAVAGRLVTRLREPPRTPLSVRETEIVSCAARGLTNAEIGRELFISEATVKTHLLRACAKLGVSGRTAAVATALDRGLLPPPGG